jgi:hypothetical protein
MINSLKKVYPAVLIIAQMKIVGLMKFRRYMKEAQYAGWRSGESRPIRVHGTGGLKRPMTTSASCLMQSGIWLDG